MFRGMKLRQIVLDALSIALCVATVAAVLLLWKRLPEQIVKNFDAFGAPRSFGGKSSIFLLLGIMVLLTGMLCAFVRIPALFRRINLPWTIPWGREGLIVDLTKDFLCVTNLCITLSNAYLVVASIRGKLLSWLLWLPYGVMFAAMIWFFVRARKVCKS